ncbi:transketolase [Conexibacter sp. JD483]|uniref:transketolase n=1 Tax=unclassified Conexibacter TaxID=2627773 RepID=UPI0027212701|nr:MULTISPECIES: transketolase [unclassified Conexibacter]MDO8184188.1 transketolase [Conexibacter sp. CPCC 205706]MDO8197180.1 transketolase [Conexibacter sp. CPCC 205762]MDR9367505.1 transketolase [Conexibacter sp. JD483]
MTEQTLAGLIRRLIIDESMRAHVGHIGSALSIADILAALYGGVLRSASSHDPERDRLVLSKGHAALALYAALAASSRLDRALLSTYCGEGSQLGAHPEHVLPGVDFSTGSLGQGLSIGAGSALAARMQGSDRQVYVLMSDAECNEGSVWEAAMFAAHHRLGNLVAIIDVNGQQAFGYTRDVLEPTPLAERWAAFGWNVSEVDGHDVEGLQQSLVAADARDPRPRLLAARTTFGKGVSFMENEIAWHYWPLDALQYERACAELAAADRALVPAR